MRYLLGLAALLLAAVVLVFVLSAGAAAPSIRIEQPARAIGVAGTLDVTVDVPGGKLSRLDIALEQNGRSVPLFSLSAPGPATLRQESADRVRITRPVGKRALPDLQPGQARIVVTAARPVLFGLRNREASVSKDLPVRLAPPQLAAVSTRHYISLGGSEAVVYHVSPPDIESGVQVGDIVYPGYPAAGAGVATSDPGLKVAFFALLYDQDLATPIRLVARDEAGNEAQASFVDQVTPKRFLVSRIELNDAFLQRVVPEILQHAPELKIAVGPGESYLPAYLSINNDLRRIDSDKVLALAKSTSPQMLWHGPFRPLGNAQVESKFADHRTYVYGGKEVDHQVHLGFDLAVTARVPVLAGNDGKVLYADYLGIYGNCVIIDHGMGIQSLYGHMSSIAVKAGDTVKSGQEIGRSGMTGLAGGDHLHFSIQLQGRPVNPVEWWDAHWVEDRVMRKLGEAGTAGK